MLQISTEQLDQAEQALREGKVIVYPTETSYALGCDARNQEAVKRIFAIKGRESSKGLPVLVASVEEASGFVELGKRGEEIAKKHWPGALNIVAKRTENCAIAESASQEGTQSIRVSSHPFVQSLLRRYPIPLTATSANISGKDAIYSSEEVERAFREAQDQPDVLINVGILPKRPPSTTIQLEGEQIEVLREGDIRKGDL